MTSQCTSYTARFETIERRLKEFSSQQAELYTKISAIMGAEQAFSVTITNLAERFDFFAVYLKKKLLFHLQHPRPPVAHRRETCSRRPHRLRLGALNLEAKSSLLASNRRLLAVAISNMLFQNGPHQGVIFNE